MTTIIKQYVSIQQISHAGWFVCDSTHNLADSWGDAVFSILSYIYMYYSINQKSECSFF